MANNKIDFTVNGAKCSVGSEVSSTLMLVDYLRNVLELRGTKFMCRESGCGACIVMVVKSPGAQPMAVNSCLVAITSCNGWAITTVEKVGNRLDGYHEVQKTLTEHSGTQCGHCTPGWIMAMYSLMQQKRDLTELEIEQSFGSNICRCTGYRPILEAYKTFAKKENDIHDIEDLCKRTGKICKKESCDEFDWCFLSKDYSDQPNIIIELKDGKWWYTVFTIKDIFEVLSKEGDDSYMLVSGNTAKCPYPIDECPPLNIDISNVSELKGSEVDQNLIIGAGNTLSELLDILKERANDEDFQYLNILHDHITKVAHIPVRNLASVAGNLMVKHQHNDFPSDIFLLLETVGAVLKIETKSDGTLTVSMQDFLKLDMKSKVITKVLLPPYNKTETHIVTFKVMPRSQNAHAIVNAGFLYKYKSDAKVIEARLVLGNLSPSFIRASETEKYLVGKDLFTNDTLQGALKVLESELVVVDMPPEPSAAYRKQLALGLFYKGLLTLHPEDSLAPQYKSGAVKLHDARPVSQAKQEYDTNPSLWPLTKPMPKLEALIQCSGEAKYTEDIPSLAGEVFAALVLATVPNGKIEKTDASKALNKPGVIAFYTAKDIPGINSFTPIGIDLIRTNEEIVCDGEVKYYNQPLGIIVAESKALAEEAAKLVEVTYSGTKTPVVVDLKTAIQEDERVKLFLAIPAINRGIDVVKKLKGKNELKDQYQMCMETLVSVTIPNEQGMEVHTSTQWADGTQIMLSRALKMDESRIDVYVIRLGGSYGLKISRSLQGAMACGLVTMKLNRPCRMIQTLSTNMRAVGKRGPSLLDYEVGVNSLGLIQYVDYTLYEAQGYTRNELISAFTLDAYYNCYNRTRWNFKVFEVITDIAKTTWCRAPGTLEAVVMAEYIMEHISYALSLDPVAVRLLNLNIIEHGSIKLMYETLKSKSDYEERRSEVMKFNKNNRWKKRGLRTAFLKWTSLSGLVIEVNIAVYQDDGSVIITHGGSEVGQGLNTVAAQVCAHLLDIDISKIQVKGNSTITTINNDLSGGSFTTATVIVGVEKCCAELLLKLLPIRKTMPLAPWDKLVKAANLIGIDLHAHTQVKRTDSPPYYIYGVAFGEVEVDILTGESEILRVDLLQDAGSSINPVIDIGQVEGAFIMGQGYFTSEHIVYDPKTGEVLTNRAWNYYVPQARDIPQDFRVYLQKKSIGNLVYLGSKATGEPPICLSVVISLALREAITSARLDSGIPTTEWFPVDGPLTTEKVCMLSETKLKDFKFN